MEYIKELIVKIFNDLSKIDIKTFIIIATPFLTIFIKNKLDKSKDKKHNFDDLNNQLINLQEIIAKFVFNKKQIRNDPNSTLYKHYIEVSKFQDSLKVILAVLKLDKNQNEFYNFLVEDIIKVYLDSLGQLRHYYGNTNLDDNLILDDFEFNELLKNAHEVRMILKESFNIHIKIFKSINSKKVYRINIQDLDLTLHNVIHRNLVINNIAIYGFILSEERKKSNKSLKVEIKDKNKLLENMLNIMKKEEDYNSSELAQLMMSEIIKKINFEE